MHYFYLKNEQSSIPEQERARESDLIGLGSPLKKILSLRDVTFTRPACTPDVCTYNVYIYIYIYKAKVGKQELPIALFLFKK